MRRAAERLGIKLRFLHHEDTPCRTEEEWLIRKAELVHRLIENGLPEAIAIVFVVLLHLWKRQMLISIAGGTICYMVLVQYVFV